MKSLLLLLVDLIRFQLGYRPKRAVTQLDLQKWAKLMENQPRLPTLRDVREGRAEPPCWKPRQLG
jgi:hypothetical protein